MLKSSCWTDDVVAVHRVDVRGLADREVVAGPGAMRR
jgi:hypothetical protein